MLTILCNLCFNIFQYYMYVSVLFNLVGCGRLYVADGNWKLRYPHCMWKVPVTVSGFGDVNYPEICPLSPVRGHAFCQHHGELARSAGYPSELREFLKYCGCQGVDRGTDLLTVAL